jgi:hypothetical protein
MTSRGLTTRIGMPRKYAVYSSCVMISFALPQTPFLSQWCLNIVYCGVCTRDAFRIANGSNLLKGNFVNIGCSYYIYLPVITLFLFCGHIRKVSFERATRSGR